MLDTCSFLWLVTANTDKLCENAISVFTSEENIIYFSVVSAWEISIKASIGKLDIALPVEKFLINQIELNDLNIVSIGLKHVTKVSDFALHHKDPFDRLLIAQAMIEGMTILTADNIFKKYGVETIWE